MTDHKQLTFTFKLLDHGWAEATLSDANASVALEASYICNPLGDLARAVVDLYKSPGFERQCSWMVEPGEFRWVFNQAGERIHLKIVWFSDWSPGSDVDNGRLLFDTTVGLKRLSTQVCGQMKQVLNDFGVDGYSQSWRRDFPVDELAVLITEIERAR